MLIDKQNYLIVQIDGRGKKGEPNYLLCLRFLMSALINQKQKHVFIYILRNSLFLISDAQLNYNDLFLLSKMPL